MSREAIRLWSKIPLEMWGRAVSEAIIQSGSFPATIGLVGKVWKERQAEIMANAEAEAHKAMREENNRRYQALPSPENRPPTNDERQANIEEFKRIQRMLGGTAGQGSGMVVER